MWEEGRAKISSPKTRSRALNFNLDWQDAKLLKWQKPDLNSRDLRSPGATLPALQRIYTLGNIYQGEKKIASKPWIKMYQFLINFIVERSHNSNVIHKTVSYSTCLCTGGTYRNWISYGNPTWNKFREICSVHLICTGTPVQSLGREEWFSVKPGPTISSWK